MRYDLNDLSTQILSIYSIRVDPRIRSAKLQVEKKSGPSTCDTCSYPGCCSQIVYASLIEMLPIALDQHKKGLNTSEYRQLLKVEGEESEGVDRMTWFRKAKPCVFLNGVRCGVYPMRPVSCRQFYAFTPQSHCMPPNNDNKIVDSMEVPGLMSEVVVNSIRLQDSLGIAPGKLVMASIPRMTYILLSALDAHGSLIIENGDTFTKVVSDQPYPKLTNLSEWIEGDNPFRRTNEQR